MAHDKELTYYEYWLTKTFWNAEWAIRMIADYQKFKRGWERTDDPGSLVSGLIKKIAAQLYEEQAWHLFGMRACKTEGVDDRTGEWKEGELVLERSEFIPDEFIKWAYNKGYNLPCEFKEHVGIEVKDPLVNQKREFAIDKATCQAIARTLWDEHKNMTIDEMQEHRAIQIYGGGKGYSTDTTLRKWLREVDPRTSKTGKKKL